MRMCACVRARVRVCAHYYYYLLQKVGQTGQRAQTPSAAVTSACPAYRDAPGQAGQPSGTGLEGAAIAQPLRHALSCTHRNHDPCDRWPAFNAHP